MRALRASARWPRVDRAEPQPALGRVSAYATCSKTWQSHAHGSMRLTASCRPHTMRDMRDSNIRTISVRFSAEEHRLLDDLAIDQGIDVERLIREALTLAPIDSPVLAPHLRLVESDELSTAPSWNHDEAVPSS